MDIDNLHKHFKSVFHSCGYLNRTDGGELNQLPDGRDPNTMELTYVSVALVTIASLLYYYFTRTFNYWKNKGVAGPTPIPFFGNVGPSALRNKNYSVLFEEIYNQFPNEKVVGIYRMTTPALLIRDLDIIKHVMIKDFDAFVDRGVEFSKEGLGANLFHADGETWRVLRNRFTPIFTSGKLKNMLYLITERGGDFIKYIEDITAVNPEQEVHNLVQKFTNTTIAATAFGLDIDTHHNQEMIDTLKRIDKLIFTLNFANELDMMYPGILKKINMSLMPGFVKTFFYGLVRDVVKQRDGKPTNRKDFMDLILELRQQGQVYGTRRNDDEKQLAVELTDDVIAAQAFVFYAAGYETSATTMAFMLYELAKNPDVQEKLVTDIEEVLKKHNGELTYETIQDMSYLEKVFDETLRMYPLVDPLQRCVAADYKVPGTNLTIPKGTMVLVPVSGIQHDPKYYPNPEQFDPERFAPENAKNLHSCAYLPFGVGPRNCIGMRFAKVQSRVCMIKILTNFRVEMSKNTPKQMPICPKRPIVGPDGGIKLNVVKRR